MPVRHNELCTLSALPQLFPLLGEYLRSATIEIILERNGEPRTHLIADSSDFPRVLIAAEGSTAVAVERYFFAPVEIYEGYAWDLADRADEAALLGLIKAKREMDDASAAAAAAEIERRRQAREAAASEAEALRTVELRAEARARLSADRDMVSEVRWDAVLRDLDLLTGMIERDADRLFVMDLAARWRRFRSPLSERQVAWLSDVLWRVRRGLNTERRSREP